MERAETMKILSILPKPAMVLSATGKKLMVAPSAIFEGGPSPKNST